MVGVGHMAYTSKGSRVTLSYMPTPRTAQAHETGFLFLRKQNGAGDVAQLESTCLVCTEPEPEFDS